MLKTPSMIIYNLTNSSYPNFNHEFSYPVSRIKSTTAPRALSNYAGNAKVDDQQNEQNNIESGNSTNWPQMMIGQMSEETLQNMINGNKDVFLFQVLERYGFISNKFQIDFK